MKRLLSNLSCGGLFFLLALTVAWAEDTVAPIVAAPDKPEHKWTVEESLDPRHLQAWQRHLFLLYRAADGDSREARRQLRYYETHGYGTARDYANPHVSERLARELGNPHALRRLSHALSDGLYGYEKDPEQAVLLLKRAADSGDAASLNEVGRLYERGSLVPKDMAVAFDYYTRASQAGSNSARISRGRLLAASGRKDEALSEYLAAAEAGSTLAWRHAGMLYARDYTDAARALGCLEKGAQGRDALAYYYLARIYLGDLDLIPIDAERAMGYLEALLTLNHAQGRKLMAGFLGLSPQAESDWRKDPPVDRTAFVITPVAAKVPDSATPASASQARRQWLRQVDPERAARLLEAFATSAR